MSLSQDNLHKLLVDVQTGITTKIKLTDEEILIYLAEQQKILESEAEAITEQKAKAEAKASAEAKLGALGLNADDLKALGL